MRYGWTLEKATWMELPRDVLRGNHWHKIQFTLLEADLVPSYPGVYAICSGPPLADSNSLNRSPHELSSFLYTALYVGKTENLRLRFTQHCNHPKQEIAVCTSAYGSPLDFWYCKLPLDKIITYESSLIACLGPPANRYAGVKIKGKLKPGRPA